LAGRLGGDNLAGIVKRKTSKAAPAVLQKTSVRPSVRAGARPLTDKQNEPDHRRLRIDKVGVRGLRFPAQVRDKNADTLQSTVATVGLFVDLPQEFKGTHMSRFVEALNAHGTVIHVENIPVILRDLQTRLHARNAHLELEFPFFLVKRAPVSGKPGVLDYTVRFDAALLGREYDFVLTVKCNVTTLCPCSKAISRFGAHNQRGEVTVQVRSTDTFWIEDLIALIESCGSSEMYSLLKREDEKAVTERAYENPVFVEDLVRAVCVKLNQRPGVTWYKVEAENYESIHNHNAYACIEKG